MDARELSDLADGDVADITLLSYISSNKVLTIGYHAPAIVDKLRTFLEKKMRENVPVSPRGCALIAAEVGDLVMHRAYWRENAAPTMESSRDTAMLLALEKYRALSR